MNKNGAFQQGLLLSSVFTLSLGVSGAQAQSQADRHPLNIFKPSDLRRAPELSEEIETPDYELDLTGRAPDSLPRLDGEVSLELQNDHTFRSDDAVREVNDLFATIDLFVAMRLTPELSLQSGLVLEAVEDPSPGDDRYFGDNGVIVETLGLVYETQGFSLFGGKIDPTFGVAWDLAPGIYGSDPPGDYELTERIGLGGAVTFGDREAGEHRLTAQTFFLDTSALSGSLGNNRGRTREEDGGVSNTESFESFSVTLDGALAGVSEGLNYHLGFERQQRGRTEPENEWGVATALYGAFDLNPGLRWEPLVEWVYLNNRQGVNNAVDYLTLGSVVYLGPWNLALSYTGRFTDPADENAFEDHAFQLSVGYEFDFGLALDIGYSYFEEDNVDNHVIGALFIYDFDFIIR